LAIAAILIALFSATSAGLAAEAAVKIGVLNDQSSPYADETGKGTVAAAQMAAEDDGSSSTGCGPKPT
jgi:branched-chain amino acid transport system substrate-binding protein